MHVVIKLSTFLSPFSETHNFPFFFFFSYFFLLLNNFQSLGIDCRTLWLSHFFFLNNACPSFYLAAPWMAWFSLPFLQTSPLGNCRDLRYSWQANIFFIIYFSHEYYIQTTVSPPYPTLQSLLCLLSSKSSPLPLPSKRAGLPGTITKPGLRHNNLQ